ncbi:TetR/AcrR family transcriptional regulator [Nocardioides marinquilinus]|uniref:TetR/AcrR family transcriptional regulator n=1 Tax=Nocardioides marinquilinus TaxID=1210400 RepID=A0ABP9Q0T4_9ACTN
MAEVETPQDAGARPRVEGERELEILQATLDVLIESGYDRLTMDAVAARARASKATLYRRWSTKAQLVIDALLSEKDPPHLPDTGTLRGDLVSAFCGMGGLTDQRQVAVLAGVLTAIARDADFAEAFHRDFIGPKVALTDQIYTRAKERGEIHPDVDVAFIGPILPGVVLHRQFLLGQAPDTEFIARVIDEVLMPAVHARGTPPAACSPSPASHEPEPEPDAHARDQKDPS